MTLSRATQSVYDQISSADTKLGDLRKIAKEIKKDHKMALELWSTGNLTARLMALLIMDKKELTQATIDELDSEMQDHSKEEQEQLIDWLMANQLSKDKRTVSLMESWEKSPSALQRRIFWYYQARLRWMGKTDFENTEDLLAKIEANLMSEEPTVQWAMNYTAGQIGKFQKKYRARCIAIGEKTGLYKDEVVPKNCTPSYLPLFIEIEAAKVEG
ncbi:MAG: DNA alkylation repair protein [Flavobacteriales bacterium]|nr:DNA alkylation repair protein [Flavobacteriales bacterium]